MNGGHALGLPSLQGAYNASPGSPVVVTLDSVRNGAIFRAGAGVTGSLFGVQDVGSLEIFDVDATSIALGYHDSILSAGGPAVAAQINVDAANTLDFWPTNRTFSTAPGALIRIGAGVVHVHDYANVSLAVLNLQHTAEHAQSGFAFNHGLIFNHGTNYRNQLNVAANYGPLQGFIDQPSVQVNRTTAGSVTQSLFRSFLSQPSFGRASSNGTLSVTTVGQVQCFGAVTTGASVSVWNRVQLGPFSSFSGSVTTYRAILIANETGPSSITGIRSELTGTGKDFINHIGTSPSHFAGDIHMNNGIALVLGTAGASRVNLLRPGAGVLRMIGVGGTNNEGLDLDFDSAPNMVDVSSSTGAGLRVSTDEIVLGSALTPDGSNNWFIGWAPGARTTQLGGDYSDVLFSAGANLTVDHAMGYVATMTLNEPGITVGTGSVTDTAVLVINTAATEGSGNNYGLWHRNGVLRVDSRLDVNNGIALGGGAPATLGTIGGAGPTAAAQAQWVEIDVNGVAHWIPAWT